MEVFISILATVWLMIAFGFIRSTTALAQCTQFCHDDTSHNSAVSVFSSRLIVAKIIIVNLIHITGTQRNDFNPTASSTAARTITASTRSFIAIKEGTLIQLWRTAATTQIWKGRMATCSRSNIQTRTTRQVKYSFRALEKSSSLHRPYSKQTETSSPTITFPKWVGAYFSISALVSSASISSSPNWSLCTPPSH